MIEVMVAAVILGIGLIGILGMQSTAAIANRRAMDIRTGMELAETTLERLKRDAIAWTALPSAIGADTWLGHGFSGANVGTWMLPPAPPGLSGYPTLNDMGLPNVAPGASANIPSGTEFFVEKNSRYCVQYRLSWVIQDELARADVRVLWASNRAGEAQLRGNCSVLAGDTIAEEDMDLFFEWVRVSGMVRWNQIGAIPTTAGL